ncbi:MAG: PHP domain-containing protein [Clostridia bacterium]|nr:PHP domain-containing protein [Clostridia bacterium]
MSTFAYDLHVHSCLSPCGDDDMTPCNIAGMAHLNGLELVALTDHNASRNCPAFFRACEAYGIIPVAGMELTTSEDIHVVCLFESLERALALEEAMQPYRMQIRNRKGIYGEQRILNENDEPIGEDPWFLPAATALDLESAAKLVDEFGGACYPAHIDREANGLLAILGAFPPKPVFRCAELREAEHIALAEGRTVVVSSDAHRLWELKEGGTPLHLDAPKDNPDAVRRALIAYLRRGAV